MPSTRNYRFYVNEKLIGNNTDGKLTVNVSPSNCVNYTGRYKCVPESTIGDGKMKTETREFECEFFTFELFNYLLQKKYLICKDDVILFNYNHVIFWG